MAPPMVESLPAPLRAWVCRRAEEMGLPGPDDYILVLLKLEKQRLDLEQALSPPRCPDVPA